MVSLIETKLSWKAFSVSVSVSASELLEQGVDALRNDRGVVRLVDAHHVDPHVVGHAAALALARGLRQVLPVHQQLRLVGLGVHTVPDAAQVEDPGAGVDGAAQRDLVAHLPAVGVGQLAPDDHTLAVQQEGLLLVVLEHVFGVQRQVAGSVHRKLRKEVAFGDVHPAEPVRPADAGDAFDAAQPVGVAQRQREGQRNGVARDQPRAGRAFHAGVPGVDDGAQQAEGADRHHQADHGQHRAQPVAKRVLEQQAQQEHVRG
jgi:hypothetical protein